MTINNTSQKEFWKHIRNYLTVYLPKIRCLSPRTIDSYRQSVSLYCQFLKEQYNLDFSKVSFEHITRDSVIAFIQWLHARNCGISTCNLRLSALKSTLKYFADEDISLYCIYQEIKKIPHKKSPKTPVKYMSEGAVKVLLEQPDIRTEKGFRNRMILILLYDTGARVQELVDIKMKDLHLKANNPFIIVTGKGNKTRSIPLMDKTVLHLKDYIRRFHNASANEGSIPLFYSIRSGVPHSLSRDTIGIIMKNYGESARRKCFEVPARVHPHLIRHTRAMHLYQAGMPLSYISEFLGHASTNTTEIYALASVKMLRKALEKANPDLVNEIPLWKNEENLKKLCGL